MLVRLLGYPSKPKHSHYEQRENIHFRASSQSRTLEDRPVVLILVVICTQLGAVTAVDLVVGQKMVIYREQQIQLYFTRM